MARASDNSGTEQLIQHADAAAAIEEAQALVSQVVASTSSAVATASAATPPSASAIAAAVKTEAMKTVAEALAPAATAASTYGQAGQPPPQPLASRAVPHARHGRESTRPHRRAAHRSFGLGAQQSPATASSGAALPAAPPPVTPRHRDAAARDDGSGAVPHQLPPLPLPPQSPTAGAQAGGQGTAGPPVAGALAAAVLVLFFVFLSRLLPRSAFRKPRRLALPPWHPG